MLGMTEEDFPDTEVWPCNEAAVDVFQASLTQWRVGMGGATGLDYAALPVCMDMVGVDAADRPGVFNDIRVMEAEALAEMREQREEREKREKAHG